MAKELIIYHFYPIEGYPPIQNLLSYLNGLDNLKVTCITTRGTFNELCSYNNIKLIRLGQSRSTRDKTLHLLISYFLFNVCGTLVSLCRRPSAILYYESISALPALIQKRLRPTLKLLIHYHEYTSTAEYQNGPALPKRLHQVEQKFYPKAMWLSHTNQDRMDFFCQDNHLESSASLHISPNYPPASWKQYSNHSAGKKVKLIYVGYSLDDNSMYASSIIRWAANNKKSLTLDFYLIHTPADYRALVSNLNADNIVFNDAISYQNLPLVLSKYDIGLILYKGTTPNYKFNAPNKLFEYLACNLDVWYPNVLKGPKPYDTIASYPKVIPVDFEQLNAFDWQEAIDKEGCEYKASNYFCEAVYQELIDEMVRH